MSVNNIVAVIFLMVVSLYTYTLAKSSASDGECMSVSSKSNRDVFIKICFSDSIGSFMYANGWRWGAERRSPEKIITSFLVQLKGKDVFVPVSSYSDLTMLKEIEIVPLNEVLQIVITGGDASVSYTATLTVKDYFVVERRVMNNEFKAEAWEETKYSYNYLAN